MKVIDFFCGSGGFSEGFRQAGFDVIWAVDKWKPAVETHQENHPNSTTILDDVIRLSNLPDKEFNETIPDSEVIIGSPPCVAFSNSNRSGKADKALGTQLYEAYLRIIFRKKHKKKSILKYWILENVPNLMKFIKKEYTALELGLEGTKTLQVINQSTDIYNAKYFSVPSSRKRFFYGEFPKPTKIITNDRNLINLSAILETLGIPKVNLETRITDPNYPDFSMVSKEITDHHYIREVSEHEWQKAKRHKQDKGYMGKMSFPENMNKPSRTIMAMISYSARESMILRYKEDQFRAPTIREIASLMSFPIDYRFYGNSKSMKYKLVGNAVPPKLSYAFAKAIAHKENFKYNTEYPPINHQEKIDFENLNLNIFHLNIEKPKKETAKFKYHVPYLKLNTFRVELTNYHSDFKNKKFRWDVEIHKSQGPDAKVFIPRLKMNLFLLEDKLAIKEFITSIEDKFVGNVKFQKYHCMTSAQRNETCRMGPYELLDKVKEFVDSQNFEEITMIPVKSKKGIIKIPYKIIVAYTVLKLIIDCSWRRL